MDGIFVEVLGIDLGLNKIVVVVVFSATHLLMDGLVHCKENPIYSMYSFSGNCVASVPISSFMCL